MTKRKKLNAQIVLRDGTSTGQSGGDSIINTAHVGHSDSNVDIDDIKINVHCSAERWIRSPSAHNYVITDIILSGYADTLKYYLLKKDVGVHTSLWIKY